MRKLFKCELLNPLTHIINNENKDMSRIEAFKLEQIIQKLIEMNKSLPKSV